MDYMKENEEKQEEGGRGDKAVAGEREKVQKEHKAKEIREKNRINRRG